MFVQQIPERI